ncbi:TetR/AcrR family transcriptional regulator [Chlorobium sp. N1]|uniref:TetR/AcrR family transcriptional regulator n=1 Tax=Chlorobium sp. N1 TaxID=2491138 RepID=UPI0010400372|nr:TetR/AcrR family transcriptional regulator [Chlorobium sp. N1]TCD47418.1 TetR/AcrR family transcriptional regulator [Chlorobium sp. N1]
MATENETEYRILRSAEEVFYRHGYDGAKMQDIADGASINKALLHYYFRSKERLFDAVFSAAVERLVPPLFLTLGSEKPLTQKIREFVDTYFDTVLEHPFLPGFVVHEMHRNPDRFRKTIASGNLLDLEGLQAALDEGTSRGEFRQTDAMQFLLNLLSLSAFPFIAARAMQAISALGEEEYRRTLDERRALVPVWMEDILKPCTLS